MWNWQRIDFSIGEYKTQQQIADIINTSQSSYAGTYLGEMLKTF